MKKQLTILVGIPGSGKSTYAKELRSYEDKCYIVSTDELRLLGVKDVWHTVDSLIFDGTINDKIEHIIIDACNVEYKYRKMLYNKWKATYEVTCTYFDIPLSTCLERVAERNGSEYEPKINMGIVHRFHKQLERPIIEFDCDYLEIVDELFEVNNG